MNPVAVAHDFLTQRGGAERVALSMAQAFTGAPLYTTLYEPEGTFTEFAEIDVRTSWLQRLRPLRHNFRVGLPLYPSAVRSLGPVPARAVVSSSTSFMHGLATRGCHLAYLHSPPHWLWETSRYAGTRGPTARAAHALLAPFRRVDVTAAKRPHLLLTNSFHSQEKISQVYGRWAEVLPPPVRMRPPAASVGDFFLVVSRLLPYKRVDLAVRAATHLDVRLVVVGTGPEWERLQALAGPTVEFRGGVTDVELDHLYATCLAVIVAGVEDLGLVPIEANSAGRPAIGFARGGALETIRHGCSGVLFDEPTVDAVEEAMVRATQQTWDREEIRAHAQRWSEPEFQRRLRALVEGFPRYCRRCGGQGLGPGPLAGLLGGADPYPMR